MAEKTLNNYRRHATINIIIDLQAIVARISLSLALFACIQLDWDTTTGRLLGLATCLKYKDGGIPLSVLPKDTTSDLPICSPHYSLTLDVPDFTLLRSIKWGQIDPSFY